MSEPLVIQVDDAKAQAWFGELLQRMGDLTPLMRDLGEYLVESTQDRFDQGIGPDGVAWAPLKDGSGRTPLNDSGRMRDDIRPNSGSDFVEIVAGARQARWHQEGTDPFVILPKAKQALSWPGGPGPRKKVNHPGLPARPFIGLSEADERYIGELAQAHLNPDENGG